MIEKKIAIITIHDINPSCAEKLQSITDQLNKLQLKFNLSVVPYYEKKYNIKDNLTFLTQIASLLQSNSRTYVAWSLSSDRRKDRGL